MHELYYFLGFEVRLNHLLGGKTKKQIEVLNITKAERSVILWAY